MAKTPRKFPYVFLLNKMTNQWQADNWCNEHFGKRWSPIDNRNGVWCCFWRGVENPKTYEWLFLNEKDATLFLLHWA